MNVSPHKCSTCSFICRLGLEEAVVDVPVQNSSVTAGTDSIPPENNPEKS